jgi:hypothetical protein
MSNGMIFHAERAGIENSLLVWDIVGISQQAGENLLPGAWTKSQNDQIIDGCYSPDTVNSVIIGKCRFVFDTLRETQDWNATILFPIWLKSIINHPGAYVHERLSFLRTLFWPNNVFVFDADDQSNGFNYHNNVLFESMKQIMLICKTTPVLNRIFTVAFWLILTAILSLICGIAVMRGRANYYKSLLLSLSAGAYVWPLLIIGIAGDFRYAYWAIGAACIALVMVGTSVQARVDQ